MPKFLQLAVIWFAINNIGNAQTPHTINYSTSGLLTNPSICNVFNITPSPIIGGYTHYPVAGGATFNGTYIKLQTQYSGDASANLGTAYAIKFPFQAGYSYSFQFTAKGTDGSGFNTDFPNINVSLFNSLPDPNQTDPTACGPVGQDKWGGLQSNTIGLFTVSASSTTYTLPGYYYPSSSSSQYIIILAYGGSTSPDTALISKITITETLHPSFTISPSTVTKTCGTAFSQTFTVNNVYSSPGVTSYT